MVIIPNPTTAVATIDDQIEMVGESVLVPLAEVVEPDGCGDSLMHTTLRADDQCAQA